MSPRESTALLIAWIAERNGVEPDALAPSTPLIEQGLLTSLQILDLLLYLEQLRGGPVDVAALTPGAFHDVRTVVARFLNDREPSADKNEVQA